MPYQHDIFISYKWDVDTKEWVDFVFLPILSNVLDQLRDQFKASDIFHDESRTVEGATVPDVLRDGVANSRCMVCVFSKTYFTRSSWCLAELSAMLKREEETGVRNNNKHVGLVFPVLFIDETETELEDKNLVYTVPPARELLNKILPLQLNQEEFFCIAAGFKGTTSYDALRFKIFKWVKSSIYPQLIAPPEWKEKWRSEEYFVSRFNLPEQPVQSYPVPGI